MIKITSRHIMTAIRESCPLSISFSLDSITLLSDSNKSFGFARFENSEEEKEVSCAWWINIAPEMTELVIRWIGQSSDEAPFSIEL